jgi:hypothetical protein
MFTASVNDSLSIQEDELAFSFTEQLILWTEPLPGVRKAFLANKFKDVRHQFQTLSHACAVPRSVPIQDLD